MIQVNEKSTPLGVKPFFQNVLSKTLGKFTLMLNLKFEHRYVPHISKVYLRFQLKIAVFSISCCNIVNYKKTAMFLSRNS